MVALFMTLSLEWTMAALFTLPSGSTNIMSTPDQNLSWDYTIFKKKTHTWAFLENITRKSQICYQTRINSLICLLFRKCTEGSNHYVVHPKPILCYVNYISIKKKKKSHGW